MSEIIQFRPKSANSPQSRKAESDLRDYVNTTAPKLEPLEPATQPRAARLRNRVQNVTSNIRIAAGTISERAELLTVPEAQEISKPLERFYKDVLAVEALVLRMTADDGGPGNGGRAAQ